MRTAGSQSKLGAAVDGAAAGLAVVTIRASRRAPGHALHYFTDENVVGRRIMLLILARIGPSRSLSERRDIHSGSDRNSLHFFSRSASELPSQHVVHVMHAVANNDRPESSLADAEPFPNWKDVLGPLELSGQATRKARIDA